LRVLDEPATSGRAFNVGSGHATTINELAEAVLTAFGGSVADWDVRREPAQTGDLRASRADIAALGSATGWAPTTSLADGMQRTIDWARRTA
jgi:UDP-glucose 4-epimerase